MIRVFLADDHALLLEGVRRILDETPDIRVLGEARSGEALLSRSAAERWDVLVLDLSLPGASGLELLGRVLAVQPRLRVLILTMHPEDSLAVRLLRLGAAGFLSKSAATADVLVGAVRTVAAGGRFLSPALAEQLLSKEGDPNRPPHERLSPRQLEILILLCRGLGTSEIAAQLDISPSTVSGHVHEIKERLGRHSLAALVRYGIEAGLV